MIVLAQSIQMLVSIISLLILIRVLLSWAPMAGIRIDPYNPIVDFLFRTTDFILEPFRRVIPPIANMDLSPIIAMLVIQLVGDIVVQALVSSAF
jgi:YggT family protein